jgi:hypothetical protein
MTEVTKVQHVALTLEDGSLAIMHFILEQKPYGDDPGWTREATDEAILDEIAKGGLPVKNWRRVNLEDIPNDRTYRNAWLDTGSEIVHDLEKVKALHLDMLRRDRVPLLEQLDREWTRATGQGKSDEAKSIESKRQALRDLPHEALKSAASLEEVKAVTLAR